MCEAIKPSPKTLAAAGDDCLGRSRRVLQKANQRAQNTLLEIILIVPEEHHNKNSLGSPLFSNFHLIYLHETKALNH